MDSTVANVIKKLQATQNQETDDIVLELAIKEAIKDLTTFRIVADAEIMTALIDHDPSDDLSHCDTGEDMGYTCRSECTDMAANRVAAVLEKLL